MTALEKLLVLLGPTASGKTALSIQLAHALDTEIISGDSMLVYRDFNIGTAKPTRQEMDGIPHHMVDILPPDASFNLMDFLTQVKGIITQLNQAGKIPLLVGGTGLYIQSLLEGYELNQQQQAAVLGIMTQNRNRRRRMIRRYAAAYGVKESCAG